jgi:hypothetical protein
MAASPTASEMRCLCSRAGPYVRRLADGSARLIKYPRHSVSDSCIPVSIFRRNNSFGSVSSPGWRRLAAVRPDRHRLPRLRPAATFARDCGVGGDQQAASQPASPPSHRI